MKMRPSIGRVATLQDAHVCLVAPPRSAVDAVNLLLTKVSLSGIGYWGRVCWLVGQP